MQAAASAALLLLVSEWLPATLPFAWGNSSRLCFTCLHSSLPILVQGVVPGAGTPRGTRCPVPAVPPAAAVLIPALQPFCQETPAPHSHSCTRAPGSSRNYHCIKESRKTSAGISKGNRRNPSYSSTTTTYLGVTGTRQKFGFLSITFPRWMIYWDSTACTALLPAACFQKHRIQSEFTSHRTMQLHSRFSLFFYRKTGKRFGCTPGTAMSSTGWSLTHHKYWQRRDNLDSMKHLEIQHQKKIACVFPLIDTVHYRCIKKRIKRSFKISFSNKTHLLQQIYSGKYGDSESRFLTPSRREDQLIWKTHKLLYKPLLKYAELGVCRKIHSTHLQASTYCPVTVTATPTWPFLPLLRPVFNWLWTQLCF